MSSGESSSFDEGKEQDVPVISLCFDYEGVRIRAADRRERFFVARGRYAMVGETGRRSPRPVSLEASARSS